ncbi:hypothetical protein MtrunA17_Chr4g0001101 [Medicago truncatula]|uniref:Uncharacterized protein n=1 Tax=Medicago truncatula TaxID=3880 RepID=G7JD89_MEDTR|nr:hypothetical protein MTR_4g006610 [Medicago truncatula]RHN58315.1 hypothetical protein MtrunA17_Chr4g0001101 [Medicago truncatula]
MSKEVVFRHKISSSLAIHFRSPSCLNSCHLQPARFSQHLMGALKESHEQHEGTTKEYNN